MTLRDQGFRFLVSPDKKTAKWFFPAEVASMVGWTDATDMDDEQFLAFIVGA